MLVRNGNRLALVCALALVVGCAGGEDIVAAAGGSAGSGGNVPPSTYGGYAGASTGGGTGQQGGGGITGGYGGASGSTLTGGFAGSGGLAGAAGAGGFAGIDPMAGGSGGGLGGGSGGGDAAAGGANAVDGTAGCGQAGNESPPVTNAGISLRYRCQDGGAKGSAIQFDLEVSTSIAAGVTLGDVEIRYYFTNEIADPLVNEMYWAGTSTDALTSAVKTTIVPMAAVPGADTYASYTLPTSTAKIVPGNPLVIKPAHHKAGYSSSFNQCDDYSYGANRDFAVFSRIAVFVKGTLAWGSVPAANAVIDASTPDGASEVEAGADAAPGADAFTGDAPSADAAAAIDAPGE
jgi:hypothetical protein